ncbi:MAG TPA: BTAD domain-containing putative transcriptional regulator [Vicinamibacteria bacterium]|nr:BTAD domain-containing putative transcriptional regulator [Vicinamibacteria bacterium]
MARLELRFFGAPRMVLDGRPVKLDRHKAEALLAYLVVEPGEHRRSELAVLLWPEHPPARARAALRRTLFALSEVIGRNWFEADGGSMAFGRDRSVWADVIAFEESWTRASGHPHGPRDACEACIDELSRAVALQPSDFLSGLVLRDAPRFDDWQRAMAERLRALRAEALEGCVRFHTERAQADEALSFAREWASQDPLDEKSHEAVMKLLVAGGRRGAALRLYEDYVRRLENELGIEPPESMTALCRQLRLRLASGRDSAVEVFQNGVKSGVSRSEGLDVAIARWKSACHRGDARALDGALDSFHCRLDQGGLYQEGNVLLELALGSVSDARLVGRVLARQGVLYSCTGRLEKARALLEEGLRLAVVAGNPLELGYCQNRLGYVLFALGHRDRGLRLVRLSVKRYREAESASGLSWALNVMGHLSIGGERALPILANSLDLARKSSDEPRIASVLNSLGKEALARKEFTRARRRLEQSLERRRDRRHRIGIADTLNNLGSAFLGLGQVGSATGALEEAFDVARSIDARPLLVEILLGMARLHRTERQLERAAELASSALHLPGGWSDGKDRARTVLAELSRELPARSLAEAVAKGRALESFPGGP